MEVRILGSGTCDPSPERRCSGYVLNTQGKTFLIDAGPGTYEQLCRYGIDLGSIDEIFISHFHVDHVNDLPAILFSRKHYKSPQPKKNLVIHGPEGFRESLEGLMNAYGKQLMTGEYQIEIMEHKEGDYRTGGITVRTLPMEHLLPTIAYRFDYEIETSAMEEETATEEEEIPEKRKPVRSLTYSGDTSPCENIVKLAEDTDCLLMEATTSDEALKEGHSTTSQAATVARQAKAKSLVLTHISPENDQTNIEKKASQFYDGIIIIATDGMRLTI